MKESDAKEITYLIMQHGYGYDSPAQAPNSLLRMVYDRIKESDYHPEDWRNAVRGMPLLWNFEDSFSVSELIQNFDKALARGTRAANAESYTPESIFAMRPKPNGV